MKKLIKVEKTEGKEQRYKVNVVTQAVGVSEGAISAYFSNKGIATKDGITAQQVIEVVNSPRRGGIDWEAVDELISELATLGYEVVDYKEEEE